MTELFIPLSDYIIMVVIALVLVGFTLLFFLEGLSLTRILDRYRLKYSFDRELEGKDIKDEDKELRLNRRERRFKRRVFKD